MHFQRLLIAIVALLTVLTAAVVVMTLGTTGVVTLKDEPRQLTKFEAIATLQNSLRTNDWCYGLKYEHLSFGDERIDQEHSFIALKTATEDATLGEPGEKYWSITLRAPEVSHLSSTARRGQFIVHAVTGLVYETRDGNSACLK